MEMSINRALSELKLLNKKITDKTGRLEVAAGATAPKEGERAEYIKQATATVQSLRDMITRRNRIKSLIVMSNAATTVTVCSESMTVAQAIERKTSIDLDKALNRRMREQYFGNKKGVEKHNETVKADGDKAAMAALGADTEGDKGAQYKTIVDAYYENRKAELLAPDNIEADIEKDQDRIDEFEAEIDFILSESNTKTTINVVD